jgi:hypothetical protein
MAHLQVPYRLGELSESSDGLAKEIDSAVSHIKLVERELNLPRFHATRFSYPRKVSLASQRLPRNYCPRQECRPFEARGLSQGQLSTYRGTSMSQ